MADWLLIPLQWIASLAEMAKRRAKSWGADRQRLMDETTDAIIEAQEFIRRASPMVALSEEEAAAITARLDELDREWRELRPKLVTQTNRHPSDEIQQLGTELAEDIEHLRHGLRYIGGAPFLGVAERAASAQSVFDRHEHAKALAAELLKGARAY